MKYNQNSQLKNIREKQRIDSYMDAVIQLYLRNNSIEKISQILKIGEASVKRLLVDSKTPIKKAGGYPKSKRYYNFKEQYGITQHLWQKKSREILDRDNYTCQNCDGPGSVVHHIIPAKFLPDKTFIHSLINLISLCTSCHRKVEILWIFNVNRFHILLANKYGYKL